jgi:hypothetical protein
MSKDFFTIIGDELYSIKNSPFFKIGQSSIHKIIIDLNESALLKNNSSMRN